jgi:hypothetical protein
VLPLFAVFATCAEWFSPGRIQAYVISPPLFLARISGKGKQAVVDALVFIVRPREKQRVLGEVEKHDVFVWEPERTSPYWFTRCCVECYKEQILFTELVDSKPTVIILHYFRVAALRKIDSAIADSNGAVHYGSISVDPEGRTGMPVHGKEVITYDDRPEVTFQDVASVVRFTAKIQFVK